MGGYSSLESEPKTGGIPVLLSPPKTSIDLPKTEVNQLGPWRQSISLVIMVLCVEKAGCESDCPQHPKKRFQSREGVDKMPLSNNI